MERSMGSVAGGSSAVAGFQPDVITCNAALCAFEKAQWLMAVRLLTKLQAQSIQPDVIAYEAVISASGKSQVRRLEAFQRMAKLRDQSILPGVIMCTATSCALEKSKV